MNQNPGLLDSSIYDEWFRRLFAIESCKYEVEYYAKGLRRLVFSVSRLTGTDHEARQFETYISCLGIAFAQYVPVWKNSHVRIATPEIASELIGKYELHSGEIRHVLYTTSPIPVVVGCSSILFSDSLPDDYTAFNKHYLGT